MDNVWIVMLILITLMVILVPYFIKTVVRNIGNTLYFNFNIISLFNINKLNYVTKGDFTF